MDDPVADAAHGAAAGDAGPAPTSRQRLVLLGAVFVVAACGLVYELVAGAVSSYLLGDAITQYSLVIGVFMCAMGLGSWLARFVHGDLWKALIRVELALALVGGLSSLTTFAAGAWLAAWFEPIFYGQGIAIGALVGLEIPILVRLLRRGGTVRGAVSDALALDYVGALLGAVAFPLLALPVLGMARASIVFGLLNLAVAAILAAASPTGRRLLWGAGGIGVVLVLALLGSNRWVRHVEDVMYQDTIVYAEQTPYQRVVVTRWRDDLRLYLDGHIQFSSVDEARYHEALVLPVLSAVARPGRVLILGGGDGLAARRVLQHPDVSTVDLVDLDPAVTDLAHDWPPLVRLNGDALSDPRVTVHHADAMAFLQEGDARWDAIIIDLPDPHSPALAKLYSTSFYALVARRLAPSGVMVTQASSPFYAPEAFWSVVATIDAAVPEEHPLGPLRALPYHAHVPSFGEWGFVLAAHRDLDPAALTITIPTTVHDADSLHALFVWDKALGARPTVSVTTLDDPAVAAYYRRGWKGYNE
ncbi:MAG: polyamine aminopropyltransferase [Alphaproteobacteria bacterium]|nr:polyamine aminopropyltransferase [Alphaproteobacteria bacterium]